MRMRDRVEGFLTHAYWQRFGKKDVPINPHFDEGANGAFFEHLEPSKLYVEFGSGGSTIQADKRSIRTISIENDRYFAAAVRKMLAKNSSVDLRVVGIGLIERWGRPVFRKKTAARLRRWRNYPLAPFRDMAAGDPAPDFVLVDGRFRVACTLEAARQAHDRNGTMTIMFDDYFLKRRNRYKIVEDFLGAPTAAGRAAVWTLAPGSLLKIPTVADVSMAAEDFE